MAALYKAETHHEQIVTCHDPGLLSSPRRDWMHGRFVYRSPATYLPGRRLRALFFICRSCDRGQSYCSQPCRRLQRRQQCRAANRRHQQSAEGRADHRDRQRAYRQRQQQARVTDQRRQRYGSSFRLWEPLAAYSKPRSFARRRQENRHAGTFWGSRPGFRPTCIRCGRAGRFVDPFHWG